MSNNRTLRIMYSLLAFAGAFVFYGIDRGYVVHAQSDAQTQYERRDWDRHDQKEHEIDEHLRTTDSKVSDHGEKISLICGVGATIVTGLGVLNLLGFLKQPRPEPMGKTHTITPE